MKKTIVILLVFISLLGSYSLKAQTKPSELLFIIVKSGDSLQVSKIFNRQTNEDKVTFKLNDEKMELKADEIESYFKGSRKVSIKVGPDSHYKLVSIILRGHITLAKSMNSKGTEVFYVRVNEKWNRLNPSSTNLKQQLSLLVPDFNKIIPDRKIHYNVVSLVKNISRYNEHKGSNYIGIENFKYTSSTSFGILGSMGLGFMKTESDIQLWEKTSTTFGVSTRIEYSRLFSGLIQLGYSQSTWQDENFDVKLRTLDLTPLIGVQLYNKSNFFKLSAALGLNVNLDISSEISNPKLNIDLPIGLSQGFKVGYDFQLHGSFGKNFDVFTSYQIMPNHNTESFGLMNDMNLEFETSIMRLGFIYYL